MGQGFMFNRNKHVAKMVTFPKDLWTGIRCPTCGRYITGYVVAYLKPQLRKKVYDPDKKGHVPEPEDGYEQAYMLRPCEDVQGPSWGKTVRNDILKRGL